MGRLFDEWKQKNAETGEKSVNDKACGELVHKRALLIFNPVAGEGRSLRLLPQVVKHMTDNGYACTTLTTINSGVILIFHLILILVFKQFIFV